MIKRASRQPRRKEKEVAETASICHQILILAVTLDA